MKKSMLYVATALLLLSIVPMQLNAAISPAPMESPKTAQSAEITALTLRLKEIKGMEKSGLTSPEKKQLRKEVRAIKSQVRDLKGGVYISTTLLLVIILLILLL